MPDNKRLSRYYELLGAPSLLHHNIEAYDDAPAPAIDRARWARQRRFQRVQARWVHGVDASALLWTLGPLPINFLETPPPPARVQDATQAEDDASLDNHDETNVATRMLRRKRSRPGQENAREKETAAEVPESSGDDAKASSQAHPNTLVPVHAHTFMRAHMIWQSSNHAPDQARRQFHQQQQYDAKYVHHWNDDLAAHTRAADQRRRNADPAYAAPLRHVDMLEDVNSRPGLAIDFNSGKILRTDCLEWHDHPHRPSWFGNVLTVLPCHCRACQSASTKKDPSVYLAYPTGTLLDGLCVARLSFPQTNAQALSVTCAVGGVIRQVVRAGTETLVARSSVYITIIKTVFGRTLTSECGGIEELQEIRRIDFGAMETDRPSLVPVDVACHPNYGNEWTSPMIAVLCQSTHADRNVIYRLDVDEWNNHTMHVMDNLHYIDQIAFSSHPMVLWASARSFVRPALAGAVFRSAPMTGHGYSLYSIDLRTNEGTFQWSPSAAEYAVEGVHSVSGIHVDATKPHTLWVASISAGRTWELDTRLPCRVLNSWSLPYMCDDTMEVTIPAASLSGSGTLFAQPYAVIGTNAEPQPMLSVAKTPGTFSFALYQRPDVKPRFQTQSLECASCPGQSFLEKMSLATSAMFALPDVGESVFTCGLVALRLPIRSFLTKNQVSQLGFLEDDMTGVVCAITMTNKGDLFSHSLLESKAGQRRGQYSEGLPLGTSALDVSSFPRVQKASSSLSVTLADAFSAPSKSFMPKRKGEGDLCQGNVTFEDAPTDLTGKAGAQRSPMSHVVPRSFSHAIRETADKHARVKLASEVVDASEKEVQSTLNCYDHEMKVDYGKIDLSDRSDSLTDLTTGRLSTWAKAWPSLDSDNEETTKH